MNQWPPVVFPFFENVYFIAAAWPIKAAWTMFGLETKIRAGLKINSLPIAISIRPNLGTGIVLPHKGIVGRHRTIVVQSQCFSGQGIQSLCQFTFGRVSGSDVELSVWSKAKTAAGMILR